MKKLFIFGYFVFFSIFIFGINVNANVKNENDLGLINGAKSGILIEESTKEILYQKDCNKRLSPASMTKIMTLLLIYEAIDNNQLSLDATLIADEYSCSMGGSQVYLEPGEKIKAIDALKCVCIASANDCAVLFAVTISGSESGFVKKMNDKVEELGLKNTHFADCTGLSSENHYSSAYDMAIISRELISKYPEVLEFTSIKEDYIRKDTDNPFWLVNTNKLLGRVDGLRGLKTGFTSFSGYCITLNMKENNMSLISVVFGYDKASTRNTESLELLRYGFSNYKMDCILQKGTELESFNHILYKNKISIIIEKDIYHLCKKGINNKYSYQYEYVVLDNTLEGKISIYNNNEFIKEDDIKIALTNNKKKSLAELVFDVIKKIIIC